MSDLENIQQGKYILWGGSCSSYSCKLRTYLIKKDIDYVEIHPKHPHFKTKILPLIGHFTVPVLETPEGDIIADSTEAIEYLETLYPKLPALPSDKMMSAVAQIIHSFGSEGLLKSIMYFRWSTSHDNRCFVMDEFARTVFTEEERSPEAIEHFSSQFRGFLQPLGIRGSHAVDVAIEASTFKLYDLLNEHFLAYPYLLGGLPSLADYGLMMGTFPHQGRDPATSSDLKMRAPALYRWMETMQRKTIIDAELYHVPQEFFKTTNLPQTLKNILSHIMSDYGNEIIATANAYQNWLDQQERLSGAIIASDCQKANHQTLGEITHLQQGTEINRVAFIDCLTHHQRFVTTIENMGQQDSKEFRDLMCETGGEQVANLRLQRAMLRDNFAYVVK